ncbi:hypothetical protein NESM_000125200 [Novymonas esmeraldas]|uniref:UspA domain-containing protein n=1 Tax=Novymonas esmeraldas TaxID=1808958 RepID=A0AAW0F5H4_9TRYP
MTTLVLCDGSDGSLRSIEVACVGNGLPTPATPTSASHTASLVLAHVWDTPAARAGAAAANSLTSNPGADAHASRRSTGNGAALLAAASGRAAGVASSAAVGGGHGGAVMSCAEVLTTTLKFVHTNKYLKHRLHYVVETACASAAPVVDTASHGAPPEAAAAPTMSAGPSAAAKAGPAQKRQSSSSGPGAGAPRRRSDARLPPAQKESGAAAAAAPTAPAAVDASAGGAAPVSASEKRAVAIVTYVAARAAHHRVTAILLGVGQRQEGKVCTVGAVAQRVLRELRHVYPLYYVKKDGVKWRPGLATAAAAVPLVAATAAAAAAVTPVAAPATPPVVAPLRYTIVVPVPASTRWGPAAEVQTEHDDEEADAHTTSSTGASPPLPKHVQAAVAAAVQYVLTHCPRSHSTTPAEQVSFAVVATSSSQDGDGAVDTERVSDVATGADVVGDAGERRGCARVSPLELYRRHLLSLPLFHVDAAEAEGGAAPPPHEDTPDAVTKDVEGAVDSATASRASLSPVVVCTLKASKKHPLLSLDRTPEVALQQIVKQLGAVKPEVLVIPASLVPEPLQLALLSASNPHCIVLPV